MSASPRGALVRRTIDLNYENKKRATSLKWIAVNGVLFLLFAYDLCRVCPGHATILHHVELVLALVALANLIQHAVSMMPRRRAHLTLSPRQQQLLGLRDTDLDRSMEVCSATESVTSSLSPDPWPAEALALSMSPQRRDISPSASSGSPRTPLSQSRHSPHSHHSPHTLHYSQHSPHSSPDRFPRDEFIADHRALADYLRQEEARSTAMEPTWGPQLAATLSAPLALPVYQLATVDTERGLEESGRGSRSPPACRRLHLDPQRLTEFHLNLRLWLHATILSRAVRELSRLDSLLAAAGAGAECRAGAAPPERLHAAAAAAGAPAAACFQNLLPFLEPFADQRYAVQRIRELSRGGCLSGYKWDGGGTDWEDSKPTDAELVLQLFASYMDTQLPGGGAGGAGAAGGVRRPFSAAHVSAAPAPAPRGPRALAVHRLTKRPPHYVLALGDETIEVCRGRDNMLDTMLVFIAAAARSEPPAIQRVHLGRAGLNLLWVIGR